MAHPSAILPDLNALGLRPPRVIAVDSSRLLTPNDFNAVLECTVAGLTLTVPEGLPEFFATTVMPKGTTTIARQGTTLINGAGISLARTEAAQQWFSILQRVSAPNSYAVSGS